MPLSPPELLSDDHQTDSFDSGESVLHDWLRRRARANQASGASRTYVVCEGTRVVAYYALASGAIDNAGVATALLSQLNAAAAARAAGHCSTAANIYTAFINAVGASGRHIASATATQLVTEAQFLIANCP